MDTLLPELLCAVLARAGAFLPALRTVCAGWRFLTPVVSKAARTLTLGELARGGHAELLVWVRTLRGDDFPQSIADRIMAFAAQGGHEKIMRKAKDWERPTSTGPWRPRRKAGTKT